MNVKKWLLGLIPIAAIVITLIAITRDHRDLQQPGALRAAMSSAEGAYFMEGVETKSFNETGNLSYTMQSPRVDHFPEDSRSEIRTPVLVMTRPSGPPWHLSAEAATARHPTGDMNLQGNVVLQREANPDYEPITMSTEQLQLNAAARQAAAEGLVRFVSPSGKVTGTGLRADLTTEQLELLANVQGEYVSPKP